MSTLTRYRIPRARRALYFCIAAQLLLALLVIWKTRCPGFLCEFPPVSVQYEWPVEHEPVQRNKPILVPQLFSSRNISLFRSTTRRNNFTFSHDCKTMESNSPLFVSPPHMVYDDMLHTSSSLSRHPLVVYPPGLRKPEVTNAERAKTWERFGGAAAWLPHHRVYLLVSRVFFVNKTGLIQSSFVRAQLFDEVWMEQRGRNISIAGKTRMFPLTLPIDIPWFEGGSFFGPEDPRIVLGDGDCATEPIIIFNMLSERMNWNRHMWAYRIFSDDPPVLLIPPFVDAHKSTQKNWMPFFADGCNTELPVITLSLIYSFQPLRVLDCNLLTGKCRLKSQGAIVADVNGYEGLVRGSTNLVRFPTGATGIQAFVGFPRTNTFNCCALSYYRPELTVIVAHHGVYATVLMSGPIELFEPSEDNCNKARIQQPLSIARVDWNEDTMVLTMSRNDQTVEVVSIKGIGAIASHAVQRAADAIEDSFTPAHLVAEGAMIEHCVGLMAFTQCMLDSVRSA